MSDFGIDARKKRRQTEAVKDKVPPIDEVDLGDADTDDSIEYLRRQARNSKSSSVILVGLSLCACSQFIYDQSCIVAMEKYPAVRMSDFDMHVKRLQANGNLKFSQEYEVCIAWLLPVIVTVAVWMCVVRASGWTWISQQWHQTWQSTMKRTDTAI